MIDTNIILTYAVCKYLPLNDIRVLDIGCGIDGSEIHELQKGTPNHIYTEITGVDLEQTVPIHGEFDENVIFVQSDGLEFLINATEGYNLIILSNMLHFFSRDMILTYLEEANNKLAPGGLMVIFMANENHSDYRAQIFEGQAGTKTMNNQPQTLMSPNLAAELIHLYEEVDNCVMPEKCIPTSWLILKKRPN